MELREGGAVASRLRPRRPQVACPLRVAVSGGIGAGKSTLALALRSLAVAYADADEIAREIVQPGQPALAQIVDRFGSGILTGQGALNRAALAVIVFADEAARADLEAITHPEVRRRALEILGEVTGPGFVVYDVPLLRTPDEAAEFDEVIMVTAPLEERLKRLASRGVSRTDAMARINAQLSDEERLALATISVSNEGTAEDLEAVAVRIAREWLLA